MSDEAYIVLERATDLWSKAQVVYDGPTRLGFPEPLLISLQIAERHPECQDALAKLFFSESQLVAAYALLTLERMGNDLLMNLPAELLECRKKVTLHTGRFSNSMDLKGLARQVQKRARYQRSTDDR